MQRRVLIVDDDRDLAETLAERLALGVDAKTLAKWLGGDAEK